MFDIKITRLLIFILPLLIISCKKETRIIREEVIDGYIYTVNSEPVYQSNVEKTKQKTTEQFISILYANLFQTTIPQTDLTDLSLIRNAIGDKQMADELIISGLVNNPEVNIPTNQQMRDNLDAFVEDTYIRFYLRLPTAYERYELRDEIESDLDMTPQDVYVAFAISNEYKFY